LANDVNTNIQHSCKLYQQEIVGGSFLLVHLVIPKTSSFLFFWIRITLWNIFWF